MRKRNCDKLFDNIFWYTLYLLPVILIIGTFFSVYHDTGTMPTPMEMLSLIAMDAQGGLGMDLFSVQLTSLATDYFFPENTNICFAIACACMGHFIIVYIFHLFVDFLLFIPRLAHKWMNDFTQGD